MNRPVVSTEELLRTNPQLQALWEKDRQIRLNQPSRTSEEAIAQALEMKRVAGLRDYRQATVSSKTTGGQVEVGALAARHR
jgi:hypothetical protein